MVEQTTEPTTPPMVEQVGTDVQGQNNTASMGETEQMTSESNINRYRLAIDNVFTGGLATGSDIVMGDTPRILQEYGAPDLKLHVSQNTVRKIVYPNGYMGGKHNLGMSAMKQLPYQIADPIAILRSQSQPNSLVLLTEWKTQDGQDVIVPLHLNKQGAIETENAVASAYGTSHIDTILGENGSDVLYTKNNEDIHQLLSNGLQLPEAMADDVLAKNTIAENEPGVKNNSAQNSDNVSMSAEGNPTLTMGVDQNAKFMPGSELDNAQRGTQRTAEELPMVDGYGRNTVVLHRRSSHIRKRRPRAWPTGCLPSRKCRTTTLKASIRYTAMRRAERTRN